MARSAATVTRHLPAFSTASSTNWASSRTWASPATSWWSATSAGAARDNGIWLGPGRGSATGSMVTYVTGITELDPIEHGLLFERFLNPERVSMPDVDLDFDERRRGDMIRYVTERYGEDNVSLIITYMTIKSKAAVKDERSSATRSRSGRRSPRLSRPRSWARRSRSAPSSTTAIPATPRPPRAARAVRRRCRRQESHRRRPRNRGPDPRHRRARGRGDLVIRAAGRRDAGTPPSRRRGPDHRVQRPGLRIHGLPQNGLPGPAEPYRPQRCGRQH